MRLALPFLVQQITAKESSETLTTLQDIVGAYLKAVLEAEFKLPVFILNDASLFALGGSTRRISSTLEFLV